MRRVCTLVIAFLFILSTGLIAGQKRPLVMDGGRVKEMSRSDQVHYRTIPTDGTANHGCGQVDCALRRGFHHEGHEGHEEESDQRAVTRRAGGPPRALPLITGC